MDAEDDVRHDFYRVGGFQSVKGAVDNAGKLVAFENHHMGMGQNGRPVMGSGFTANEFPLTNVDNGLITQTLFHCDTPAGPWRAPRSNTNAFVVQSFLDELAHAAGRDYLDFLLEIMGEPRWLEEGNVRAMHTGRAAGVIRLAAEKAGWGRQLPARTGLGLAFYFSHAGHIAEVAEVHVDENKKVTVKNVTVGVDVGPIINRSGATSQVAGAVVDGLSTMAGQKITMEGGAIEQSNLHDYPVLRLPEAPNVDIHFIESDYRPTGLGEPALPPLAPRSATRSSRRPVSAYARCRSSKPGSRSRSARQTKETRMAKIGVHFPKRRFPRRVRRSETSRRWRKNSASRTSTCRITSCRPVRHARRFRRLRTTRRSFRTTRYSPSSPSWRP